MPTLMPSDTAAALDKNAKRCDSRSLLLDRFCDPTAKEDARKQVFTQAFAKTAHKSKVHSWSAWLSDAATQPSLLHAQLQSRLMVNMAGGVMENAGLCLDRFGLPYVPGSAVKGCARRAAMFALLEAESPETKADLLFNLSLIFGWADTDWKRGRKHKRENGRDVEAEPHSDFWWAMSPDSGNRAEDDRRRDQTWRSIAPAVIRRLLDRVHVRERRHPEEPWRDLPNFAGSVSFLPAYPADLGKIGKVEGLPLEVPALGKLELDVVTCHHRDYYEGRLRTATDTEEPVPVFFPAVAPGHSFTFAILPLRSAEPKLLELALTWLRTGLEVFGLGAKTNAGYGWFDASEVVQNAVRKALDDAARREREAREREQAEQQRRAEEAERLRQKREREAALAGLSGDALADREIELLSDSQFDAKVCAFCKEPNRGGPTEEQKKAIVRALRGPRLAYWQTFKAKATKGKLATVDQAIRQLSKQMFSGKEGKMP